jgi:hypothetical protein
MMPPSKIQNVKQSPLNEKQWCCQLDCGHDQWVTSNRRPTRKTLVCDKCAARMKEMGAQIRRTPFGS